MVVNIWEMVVPLPLVAPEIPDSATVQLKIASGTLLVRAMDVTLPEQIIWDKSVVDTMGNVLTVIITVFNVPEHPFKVWFTVYVPDVLTVIDGVVSEVLHNNDPV